MTAATERAPQPVIRVAVAPDLPRIVEIYNAAIPTRQSTADLEPVSVRSRVAWFAIHDAQRRPIWVIEEAGVVVGWLSFSDYYGRPAYHATVEVGLYLAPEAQRRDSAGCCCGTPSTPLRGSGCDRCCGSRSPTTRPALGSPRRTASRGGGCSRG